MAMLDNGVLNPKSMIQMDPGTTVDYKTSLFNTQTRTWKLLTDRKEEIMFADGSDEYLRRYNNKKFNSVVLYVDLVGSTQIVLGIPEEKIAKIFNIFTYEMANLISQHRGFVLKYVGDAVIGYFVAGENGSILPADDAMSCSTSMLRNIESGINPILEQYGYPSLQARIGMDYGTNIAVKYGLKTAQTHYDLIGRSMNMAAKIQGMARPNQMLVGNDTYTRLHPNTQKKLDLVIWEDNIWNYQDRNGDLYKVYTAKKPRLRRQN